MKLQPDRICRIVGVPANSNRLVRTVSFDTADGEWKCEALQTLSGWLHACFMGMPIVAKPMVVRPGQYVCIPAAYLRPLYDGDADEGWVERLREVQTLV
jgi:hypothetical protein